MRKAIVITILLALTSTATAAMAADGVVYSDEQLGFSFEMPSDFEYYADLADQASAADVITMQPMYVGYDANVSVTYGDGEEEFADLAKRLPDGVDEKELDLYMMPEKDKEEFMQSLLDEFELVVQSGSVMSSEWKDYGGKLCAYIAIEGKDEASGLDYYQGSLSFMYSDYFISITYTKVNADGSVTLDDAKQEFEECFSTLSFDVVPSDKNLRIKTGIDWTQAVIWGISGAAGAALIYLIIHLIVKKTDKKRFSGGNYGNGDQQNDNKDGGI